MLRSLQKKAPILVRFLVVFIQRKKYEYAKSGQNSRDDVMNDRGQNNQGVNKIAMGTRDRHRVKQGL